MDIHDLFLSCRKGDLGKVMYLVDTKEVEINNRDKWDSTPLYYACLCGHEELVKYLLERGARCESNTFDGERCLYASLTDRIRNLLKGYQVVSSKLMRRDQYEEFMRKLFENSPYSDVMFSVHEEKFHAHRCIICVRCDFFSNMIQTRWKGQEKICLNHHMMNPVAFKELLQYIYTGGAQINIDDISDVIRLSKQCQLYNFVSEIERALKKKLSFESTKPGVNVTTLVVEPSDNLQLQRDFGHLAQKAIPPVFRTWINGELPFEPEDISSLFADICFNVDGYSFCCHKVFFCGRSDYFKALLDDHFHESENVNNLPVITLHSISPEVFLRIVYYVYQDTCDLNADNCIDVLCAADQFLLPGLKKLCASQISKHLDLGNVINVLRISRLFSLPKLEDQCAEYIAANIESVIKLEEFAEFVKEDASDVSEREETDTIGIIDDVRFHITNFVKTFSEMQEANEKLQLIDNLLLELDIEG